MLLNGSYLGGFQRVECTQTYPFKNKQIVFDRPLTTNIIYSLHLHMLKFFIFQTFEILSPHHNISHTCKPLTKRRKISITTDPFSIWNHFFFFLIMLLPVKSDNSNNTHFDLCYTPYLLNINQKPSPYINPSHLSGNEAKLAYGTLIIPLCIYCCPSTCKGGGRAIPGRLVTTSRKIQSHPMIMNQMIYWLMQLIQINQENYEPSNTVNTNKFQLTLA